MDFGLELRVCRSTRGKISHVKKGIYVGTCKYNIELTEFDLFNMRYIYSPVQKMKCTSIKNGSKITKKNCLFP